MRDNASREASILKNLDHPNILKYKDVFLLKNKIKLIIEFCDFGDLKDQIIQVKKEKSFFKEELILLWIIQLLEGLEYIHSYDILHRDLKSENIFIDAYGNLKIGDFGVSRQMRPDEDRAQTYIGTVEYMSPEMILPEKYYNEKTDVWSIGEL